MRRDAYFQLDRDFVAHPDFSDTYSFDAYISEKRGTEDKLREELSAIWTPPHDFEVAADENIAFTMCGGLYQSRVMCRDYLAILHRVLQGTRMRDKWVYNTSVELTVRDGVALGLFELRGGTLFVLSEGLVFDFVKCFSRSRGEAEAGSNCTMREIEQHYRELNAAKGG
jgi:hypothetical protein